MLSMITPALGEITCKRWHLQESKLHAVYYIPGVCYLPRPITLSWRSGEVSGSLVIS